MDNVLIYRTRTSVKHKLHTNLLDQGYYLCGKGNMAITKSTWPRFSKSAIVNLSFRTPGLSFYL